jgi:hypothetical protein
MPLHVNETKCHLWTKHPDALNTIGDGVTLGLAAELESPLASALERVSALQLQSAKAWLLELESVLASPSPTDADKHKACNRASGYH